MGACALCCFQWGLAELSTAAGLRACLAPNLSWISSATWGLSLFLHPKLRHKHWVEKGRSAQGFTGQTAPTTRALPNPCRLSPALGLHGDSTQSHVAFMVLHLVAPVYPFLLPISTPPFNLPGIP